ncbi:helix-turn-helix domain-containing protein [Thermodesulfobacteriota bacterium]
MVEKIYPVSETAKILNVSSYTVRSWYYQGRLNGIKLGRRVMFAENELQKFIDEGREQARANHIST